MQELEVFFDYACPYCLRGHGYLLELLPRLPELDIKIIWRPCESHPRPDSYGPHSDLCIQGLLYVMAQGGDVMAYHARTYKAALQDRVKIEDIDALTDYVRPVLSDPEGFRTALQRGDYLQAQQRANQYAFTESGVWVVPSYRMGGRRLDAVENIGVPKQQLADFLGLEG